ncbi:MAG: RNA polymerase sigma factor [Holophagaceae bacterium]|nr:RNA polymerase sigma factor [Holophagaceae bacterium]
MDSTQEQELIAAAREGDGQAFAALVEPSLGMLFTVIQRILGDPTDAQDALQEALLSIHLELGKFEGKSKFSTWAYRICVNEALMLRRSRMRRREDSVENFQPRFSDDGHLKDTDSVLAWRQDAEALEMAERLQLRAKVVEGLDRLSDDQRAVFVLKDLEGWDTEDIAMHLGISRDLVRQRLHRAHLGMRGHLVAFAAQVRGAAQGNVSAPKRTDGGRP